MIASIIYNVDGKDGELLTLIRIMYGRLSTKSLIEHVLAPVRNPPASAPTGNISCPHLVAHAPNVVCT